MILQPLIFQRPPQSTHPVTTSETQTWPSKENISEAALRQNKKSPPVAPPGDWSAPGNWRFWSLVFWFLALQPESTESTESTRSCFLFLSFFFFSKAIFGYSFFQSCLRAALFFFFSNRPSGDLFFQCYLWVSIFFKSTFG